MRTARPALMSASARSRKARHQVDHPAGTPHPHRQPRTGRLGLDPFDHVLDILAGQSPHFEQEVTLFETGLLREAEEALRAAEVAYQLGERSVLDVLDAQRLLRTVRLNFLNAQFDRQAALIDLDEMRGLPLPGAQP